MVSANGGRLRVLVLNDAQWDWLKQELVTAKESVDEFLDEVTVEGDGERVVQDALDEKRTIESLQAQMKEVEGQGEWANIRVVTTETGRLET